MIILLYYCNFISENKNAFCFSKSFNLPIKMNVGCLSRRFVMISDDKVPKTLISGSGGVLEEFALDGCGTGEKQTDLFCQYGSNVRGFATDSISGSRAAWGEREVAWCERESDTWQISVLSDWIWHLTWCQAMQLAVLFGHNSVVLYKIKGNELNPVYQVRSENRCLITSGLLCGSCWQDIYCISGTVFGSIVIWKPSLRMETSLATLSLHEGAVFGLSLDQKRNLLASVSDDRTLRVWKVESSVWRCLDVGYGHDTRPWTVTFAADYIVSAGDGQSSLCLWILEDEKLFLVKRINLHQGCVVSVDFCSKTMDLAYCCVAGALGVLKIPAVMDAIKYRQIDMPISEDQSLCSFAVAHSALFYTTNKRSVFCWTKDYGSHLVAHDANLKYDTLLCSEIKNEQQLCAFASAKGILYVLDVDSPTVVGQHKMESDNLFNLLWVGHQRILVSLSDGIAVLFQISTVSTISKVAIFNLPKGRQRWASCASEFSVNYINWLAIGDRNGALSFYEVTQQNPQPKQLICAAHGRSNVVTDLFWHQFEHQLWSIGRDGHLRKWCFNQGWSAFDSEILGAPDSLEWPAKFMKCEGQSLWIVGFHANKLHVFDYDLGQYLCSVECGGGHRHWELRKQNDAVDVFFVKQSKLFSARAFLWKPTIFKPHLHTQQISAVIGRNNCIVTAGIDTCITVSDNSTFKVIQRLKRHLSSVHCLAVWENLVCSGGGRSELIVWKFTDRQRLIPLASHRQQKADSAVRILSAAFMGGGDKSKTKNGFFAPDQTRLVGDIYRLLLDSLDLQPILWFSPRRGCCVKLKLYGNVGLVLSTDGYLNCFALPKLCGNIVPDSEDPQNEMWSLFLEKCGLSALEIVDQNGEILAFIGSESGCISAVRFEDISQKPTSNVESAQIHSATVTGICKLNGDRCCSVGIDQRLCVWHFYRTKLVLEKVIFLAVPDPADLIEIGLRRVAVVGNGVQVVDFDAQT